MWSLWSGLENINTSPSESMYIRSKSSQQSAEPDNNGVGEKDASIDSDCKQMCTLACVPSMPSITE